MINLRSLLRNKKYRHISKIRLVNIINWGISHKDYSKLDGFDSIEKANILYDKWHRRSQKKKVVAHSTSHNTSSFQFPSFFKWKKRILKDYDEGGCDWVAMRDFYNYMKELINKKR